MSITDVIESLVPILEAETKREMNGSQIANLIDSLDYEGRRVTNRYEWAFFLDKVWNSLETQSGIWNTPHKTMKQQIKAFHAFRDKLRADSQKSFKDKMEFAPQDIFKPYSLKDYLPPFRHQAVPHDRNLVFTVDCHKAVDKYLLLTVGSITITRL